MASLQLVGDDPEGNKRLQQMLNDPDDKHLDPEEGEYHFSDDDISYEVETEPAKPAGSPASGSSLMAKLNNYRRVIISTVVFLLLVILVYKMVVPGSSTPDTDIMPMAAPPPIEAQQVPSQVEVSPEPQVPVQAAAQQVATQQPVQQPVASQQQSAVVDMPAMIPVDNSRQVQQDISRSTQQTVPQAAAPVPQQAPGIDTSQPKIASGMDSAIAAMAATNEKLIAQLQAEYSQRLNDYREQNRDLQNHVQSLTSQVSNLEAQIQKLAKQATDQKISNQQPLQIPQPKIQPEVKKEPEKPKELPVVSNNSGFSVQAIIPGRAWLRAENGETITVTEGDKIKGLGTVSKIDPYDGVVEVNTGSKIISISYSNND